MHIGAIAVAVGVTVILGVAVGFIDFRDKKNFLMKYKLISLLFQVITAILYNYFDSKSDLCYSFILRTKICFTAFLNNCRGGILQANGQISRNFIRSQTP